MNMQNIMAQAQKMQREITKKKEEINEKLFPGKSEWVDVEFNGKKELLSINIKKDSVIDIDDIEVLEDMVSIAVKDALSKVDREISDKLGAYGQSIDGLM